MQTEAIDTARVSRFNKIVGAYRDDLFRYAFWLNRNYALAEDVVQDAMLRAWKSLDSLREDAAAKQWLLTIVRRENARQFERKRLETVDIDDLLASQQAFIATDDSTDVNDVRQEIFKLADDYREPLALQVLLGFSTKEIAQVMDIKPGAVLTRLHRARQQLRGAFESDETVGGRDE